MSAPLSTLSRRTFLALTGAAAASPALSSFAATTTPQRASTGVLPTFPPADDPSMRARSITIPVCSLACSQK